MLDALPMTPSGKVQKYVLRERFLAATAAQPTSPGAERPPAPAT
jgi:acyl-coenzyme A synthetase/AMP-(fatty) acid ligase